MCSPKPPKPDPAIGQAAKQNADIAQQQLDAAKEQLAWEKDRAKVQDPLVQKIVDQQISQGDANAARSDEQWQIYKNQFQPIEQRMVDDANNFDSQERKDRMAGQAAADVTQGYASATDQNNRAMERMGVNPNSGKFQALNNETALGQAKDTAGAMNKARTDTELQGIALRTGAAQFGRNMPNTGIAADSVALNAGNSATSNLNAGNAAHAAGLNSAAQWFGGAAGSNQSSANIGLGLYQGQLQRNQMQTNQLNSTIGGIGSLMSLGAMSFLRKGGVIKNFRPYRPSGRYGSGGLGRPRIRGYAEGGVVKLSDAEEADFQNGIRQTPWYSEFKNKYGEEPDLNTPDYDYRAAWKNGVRPQLDPYDGTHHWSSGYKDASGKDVYLKSANHPTMWMQKFFERTGGKDPREFGLQTPEDAEAFLAAKGYAKGGMIRGSYGLSSLRKRGYAEGGMIEGPGTGSSDSIPASIEGVQPIKLSNGEAVLNKEAVELVGEDFIHRINAGGLAMLKRDGREEMTEGVA